MCAVSFLNDSWNEPYIRDRSRAISTGNTGMKKERVSLYPKSNAIVLSFVSSLITVIVAWTIRDNISSLKPSSDTLGPRYLKQSTVSYPRLLICILLFVCHELGLIRKYLHPSFNG